MLSFRRVAREQLVGDLRLADAAAERRGELSVEALLALQAIASRSSPSDLFAFGVVAGRPYIAPYADDVVRTVADGFVLFEKSHAVFSVSNDGMLATLRDNIGSTVTYAADPASGEIFDVLATIAAAPHRPLQEDWPLYDSLAELQKGWPPPKRPRPTSAEVKQLQAAVARQPHIPFEYLRDGCTARAEAMCSLLIDHLNVNRRFVTKIWIICRESLEGNDSRGYLEVKTDLSPMCGVRWSWHVAPLIEAKTGFFVIDPAVSDLPLKRSTWRRTMNVRKGAALFQYSRSERYYCSDGSNATPDDRKELLLRELRHFNDLLLSQIVNCGPIPYSTCWVDQASTECATP